MLACQFLKMVWEICYAVQKTDCARCCDCEKKFHLISRYFSMTKTNTSSFFLSFFAISHFTCPLLLPFLPLLIFNISLFLSSRSTLSANSCLSAAQKWLCLADSTDKRLNAYCPQRRRSRGRGGENRGKLRKDKNNNYYFGIICKTPAGLVF